MDLCEKDLLLRILVNTYIISIGGGGFKHFLFLLRFCGEMIQLISATLLSATLATLLYATLSYATLSYSCYSTLSYATLSYSTCSTLSYATFT